jgi:hypothetical protein
MLCAFTKGASGCPGAGWRLSRRQHGGGTKRPFKSNHRHIQYSSWFVFAQEAPLAISTRPLAPGRFLPAPLPSKILRLALEHFLVARLFSNTEGTFNCAFGWEAMVSNISGGSNTAIGNSTLFNNTTGFSNTAIGGGALEDNTAGDSNTALGVLAGGAQTTALATSISGRR